MVPLVFIRILSGERYRKATPAELQWYAGYFCCLPVVGFLFVYFGKSFLDRVSFFGNWLYAMGAIFVFGFFPHFWGKYVPAKVSWILGAVIWTATLALSFSGKL